jgi:proline iminopeptidase
MKLFPKIRPYRKGYLDVSDGHKLYYELCGNPKGKPVLYVHGGPGAGCKESDRRFFNPKKFNIVLFDQRGAGRSKPFASTKANTTQKLVQDMRQLLQFLKIKKVFLFGGSWGSTLSLVYGLTYPETVSGMLLRGIFLATKEEIKHAFERVNEYFPDAWERFVSMVPKNNRRNVISYYLEKMKSKNKRVAEKYAYEWAYYELSMLNLDMPRKKVIESLRKYNYRSLAILEAHYMKNNCFLPHNFILKNAHKLKMPVTIVHGRYDVICTPLAAYLLHKKIKHSRLFFVLSGHGANDANMQSKLLEEMKKFT